MDPLPRPLVAPDPEGIKGRLPRRQVVRHGAPLVPAAHDREDGVDDLASAVARGSSTGLDGRDQRFENGPLGIAQVAGIRFAHGGALILLHVPSLAYPYPFKTVS